MTKLNRSKFYGKIGSLVANIFKNLNFFTILKCPFKTIIRGVGLDFCDSIKSSCTFEAPNEWLQKFLDGCKADCYLEIPPNNAKKIDREHELGNFVEKSRLRADCQFISPNIRT